MSGSSLDKLVLSLSDLKTRLDSRKKVSPALFSENMKLREDTHHLGMTSLLLLGYYFSIFLTARTLRAVTNAQNSVHVSTNRKC